MRVHYRDLASALGAPSGVYRSEDSGLNAFGVGAAERLHERQRRPQARLT
jgi:hypothetical protein